MMILGWIVVLLVVAGAALWLFVVGGAILGRLIEAMPGWMLTILLWLLPVAALGAMVAFVFTVASAMR